MHTIVGFNGYPLVKDMMFLLFITILLRKIGKELNISKPNLSYDFKDAEQELLPFRST
jgi:hypothetical protein